MCQTDGFVSVDWTLTIGAVYSEQAFEEDNNR